MKYLKIKHKHKDEKEKTFFIPETSISAIEHDGEEYKIYLHPNSLDYAYSKPFKVIKLEWTDKP
jgi:hypothetical protein